MDINGTPSEMQSNIGQLMTMCSQSEFHFRIETHDISIFEKNARNEPDFSRAVKKFARSAAGSDVDSNNSRPEPVLLKTMDYLIGSFANDTKHEYVQLNFFLVDRFRGIRSDFKWLGATSIARALILELQLRYFILTGYILIDVEWDQFTPNQHLKAIDDAFADLFALYENGVCTTHQLEFYTYAYLFQTRDISVIPPAYLAHPLMQYAQLLIRYVNTFNFSQLFAAILSPTCPILIACIIMQAHMAKFRDALVKRLLQTTKFVDTQVCPHGVAQHLANSLFLSLDDAQQYLLANNTHPQIGTSNFDETSIVTPHLLRSFGFDPTSQIILWGAPGGFIENNDGSKMYLPPQPRPRHLKALNQAICAVSPLWIITRDIQQQDSFFSILPQQLHRHAPLLKRIIQSSPSSEWYRGWHFKVASVIGLPQKNGKKQHTIQVVGENSGTISGSAQYLLSYINSPTANTIFIGTQNHQPPPPQLPQHRPLPQQQTQQNHIVALPPPSTAQISRQLSHSSQFSTPIRPTAVSIAPQPPAVQPSPQQLTSALSPTQISCVPSHHAAPLDIEPAQIQQFISYDDLLTDALTIDFKAKPQPEILPSSASDDTANTIPEKWLDRNKAQFKALFVKSQGFSRLLQFHSFKLQQLHLQKQIHEEKFQQEMQRLQLQRRQQAMRNIAHATQQALMRHHQQHAIECVKVECHKQLQARLLAKQLLFQPFINTWADHAIKQHQQRIETAAILAQFQQQRAEMYKRLIHGKKKPTSDDQDLNESHVNDDGSDQDDIYYDEDDEDLPDFDDLAIVNAIDMVHPSILDDFGHRHGDAEQQSIEHQPEQHNSIALFTISVRDFLLNQPIVLSNLFSRSAAFHHHVVDHICTRHSIPSVVLPFHVLTALYNPSQVAQYVATYFGNDGTVGFSSEIDPSPHNHHQSHHQQQEEESSVDHSIMQLFLTVGSSLDLRISNNVSFQQFPISLCISSSPKTYPVQSRPDRLEFPFHSDLHLPQDLYRADPLRAQEHCVVPYVKNTSLSSQLVQYNDELSVGSIQPINDVCEGAYFAQLAEALHHKNGDQVDDESQPAFSHTELFISPAITNTNAEALFDNSTRQSWCQQHAPSIFAYSLFTPRILSSAMNILPVSISITSVFLNQVYNALQQYMMTVQRIINFSNINTTTADGLATATTTTIASTNTTNFQSNPACPSSPPPASFTSSTHPLLQNAPPNLVRDFNRAQCRFMLFIDTITSKLFHAVLPTVQAIIAELQRTNITHQSRHPTHSPSPSSTTTQSHLLILLPLHSQAFVWLEQYQTQYKKYIAQQQAESSQLANAPTSPTTKNSAPASSVCATVLQAQPDILTLLRTLEASFFRVATGISAQQLFPSFFNNQRAPAAQKELPPSNQALYDLDLIFNHRRSDLIINIASTNDQESKLHVKNRLMQTIGHYLESSSLCSFPSLSCNLPLLSPDDSLAQPGQSSTIQASPRIFPAKTIANPKIPSTDDVVALARAQAQTLLQQSYALSLDDVSMPLSIEHTHLLVGDHFLRGYDKSTQ